MVETHRKGRWEGSEYFHEADYVLATDYAALEAERDEWKRRTYRIVGHIEEADSIDLHAIIAIAEGRDNG